MARSLNLGSIARNGEQCYNGDALRQALLKRGVFTESNNIASTEDLNVLPMLHLLRHSLR